MQLSLFDSEPINPSPRITTPKKTYTMDYPAAVKYAETQMDIYWLPTEINVEKDIQDLRVELTPAELHGVITTLKLFTLYELLVGNEYWGGRIKSSFPRPDIEFMATTFGFVEIGIHARFYNRINEILMLDTDEFYESYIHDHTLKDRIDFVTDIASHDNLPLAIGAFSMLEGAVLYSSFAFLKHFQANGKNKIKNICSGINFSVRDENLHAEAGAWLFNTLVSEMGLTPTERSVLEEKLREVAFKIYGHEARIVDMIFAQGDIDGIDQDQLNNFIKSRLNMCMENLNCASIFTVDDNPIANWFYVGINAYQLNDFFYAVGNEYNRTANESEFTW